MVSEHIEQLTDENFSRKAAKGVLLVDFFAEWCGPCKRLAPILEGIAIEMKGKASIGKINIESEQQTTATLQVTAFPTMILFKDGIEMGRLVGLRDAETIKKFLLSAF